jgi:protein TonB
MNDPKRLTWWRDVAVSVAIHACLAIPLVIWIAPRIPRLSSKQLHVQPVGIVAHRQTVAKQKRIVSAPSKAAAPTQKVENKTTAASKEAPVSPPVVIKPTESVDRKPDLGPLPQENSKPHEEAGQSWPRPQAGGDVQQPQQMIASHDDGNDRIRTYIAELTKRLQSNLIYPPEAKKKKIEGISLVSFVIMESGEIQPNTLAVKRSSGNAGLDASALRTVASSAPFQKPPRELNVSIGLNFEVGSKIF